MLIFWEFFLRENAKFWTLEHFRLDTHLSTIPPFPVAINLENVKFSKRCNLFKLVTTLLPVSLLLVSC